MHRELSSTGRHSTVRRHDTFPHLTRKEIVTTRVLSVSFPRGSLASYGVVFRLDSATDYLQINYGGEQGAYFHHGKAGRRAAWFGRQDYSTIRRKGFQISRYENAVGKW